MKLLLSFSFALLIFVYLIVEQIEAAGFRRGYDTAFTSYGTAMHCAHVTEDTCGNLGFKKLPPEHGWKPVIQENLEKYFKRYKTMEKK